jgi:hypothetical protein
MVKDPKHAFHRDFGAVFTHKTRLGWQAALWLAPLCRLPNPPTANTFEIAWQGNDKIRLPHGRPSRLAALKSSTMQIHCIVMHAAASGFHSSRSHAKLLPCDDVGSVWYSLPAFWQG